MANLGRKVAVAVGLVGVLAAPACKQILGLHERSEVTVTVLPDAGNADGSLPDAGMIEPVPGKCGGISHPSQACADCMDANCCGEATSCRTNAACEGAFECLFKCGDDGACRARCNQFYSRDETLMQVSTCRQRACSAECGLSCGGLAYTVPGCDTCVRSACCGIASECAKSVECVRLDLCRATCLVGSASCPARCDARHPDGQASYAPWLDCVQNTCGSACQSGKSWACLDTPVLWPRPKTLGDITFSMTLVDLRNENPYASAKVKACRKLDVSCSSPLTESTSDAEGLVALTVPGGSVGFDGYLEITGGDNGGGQPGSPIYPALWYPVPPIIADGWRGRVQFTSSADLPLLAAVVGVSLDPERGHFAANAADCNFANAGGVSFTADAIEADPTDTKLKTFYFIGGFPSISATATDPLTAIGGFVNLPARAALVTATSTVAGNKKVASLTFSIRAGWFTISSLPPIP